MLNSKKTKDSVKASSAGAKNNQKIQEIAGNVLSLLGLDSDQYSVEIDDQSVQVNISLPDDQSGVFIGHRGETITSLQLLLSLVIDQRLGEWQRVRVNVGDYQERRHESLIAKADTAVENVISTGQEIIIPNLNAYERQLVHSHLTDHPDVTTESRGTSPYRQLFVVPRSLIT